MKGGIIVDWNAIKAEYIAGGTSYRKLAEKYGVSESTLKKKAAKECWKELRNQTGTETELKMKDSVSDSLANDAAEAVKLGNEASLFMLRQIKEDAATGLLKETQITAYSRAIEQLRKNLGVKEDTDTADRVINVYMGVNGDDYSV